MAVVAACDIDGGGSTPAPGDSSVRTGDAGAEADASMASDASSEPDAQVPRRCTEGEEETRTRFQYSEVAHGEACISESQVRRCEGGAFGDWSGTFAAEDCKVVSPAPCDGVPHGGQESRTRYATASVVAPASCMAEPQTRTCDDGTWGAWSGTFTQEQCDILECDADTHEERTRFAALTVPYRETCRSEVQRRWCESGKFVAWTGSYEHETCEVEAPVDCVALKHGEQETRVRYLAPEAFNRPCKSETQSRTCYNGKIGEWSGTFAEPACVTCTDADGDKHGAGCLLGPDCDESHVEAYTGASEVEWNRIDENCDGKLGRRFEVEHAYAQVNGDLNMRIDRGHLYTFAGEALYVHELGALDAPVAVHRGFTRRAPIAGRSTRLAEGVLAVGGYNLDVVVYDARELTQEPAEVLRLPATRESSFALSRDGQRLYVTTTRVDLYDLSNPREPKLVGELALPRACRTGALLHADIADDGKRVSVACETSLNVHTVYATRDLTMLPTPEWVQLYVANELFDAADSGVTAYWESSVMTAARTALVRIVGERGEDPRLEKFTRSGWDSRAQVSDDAVLSLVGNKDGQRRICRFTLHGADTCSPALSDLGGELVADASHAVIGYPGGLVDFDVSDVAHPVARSRWQAVGSLEHRYHTVRDGRAYLPSSSGLVILDLENFAAPPVVLGGGPLRQSVIGEGLALVKGDYVGGDVDQIWLVDLTDAQAPTRRALTSMTADFLDGGAFTERDGRRYFVAREGEWYDVTDGQAFTKVERTSGVAYQALDDGEALYRLSDGAREIHALAHNGEERLYGQGVDSFALHDGLLYWAEQNVLFAADPRSGELVGSAQHDRPLYNLIDAGPVLISGEWLESSWTAYDPEARRFSSLELPPEVGTCKIATAGEGHLLCSTGERLYVLGVRED